MVRALRYLTTEARNGYIVGQVNQTAREIGDKVGLSARQVKRIRKRYKINGKLKRKKGSGRPQVLTKNHKIRLINAIIKNPCQSLSSIVANLNLPCCNVTAKNFLKSKGYSYKKTRPRPYLSYKNVEDRLLFAENYADYDFEDAIFVDESVFQVGKPCYGWSKVGSPIPRETYVNPPSIGVWAAISMQGKVSLTFYDYILNRWTYSELLEEALFDEADALYGRRNWTLVQDGAPAHRAAYTIATIQQRGDVIRDWPGASPDINPIENVWNVLKNKVYQRNPRTQMELETYIREEWDDLDDNIVISIAESMPRRLEMLIETEGHHTGY